MDALLAHWQDQGISVGTLKNRLSARPLVGEESEQAEHHCQGQQRLRHRQAGIRRQGVQGTGSG